jgi:hypothetical protein
VTVLGVQWYRWDYFDAFEFDIVWINYICKGFIVDYVFGYYSTLWSALKWWIYQRFPCRQNATNPWYYVRFFCFGRKLNRADSKNSVMTLTRIQQQMYLNFSNFWISKDIVWAYGFNDVSRHWLVDVVSAITFLCILMKLQLYSDGGCWNIRSILLLPCCVSLLRCLGCLLPCLFSLFVCPGKF